MEFSKTYNRDEFLNFLRRDFLPNDFSQVNESVVFATKTTYSKQATKLGVCKSLDLVVYEIKHSGKDDPRVGLSKEAFRMLSEEWQSRALVLFVPENNASNYRFSLIEIKLEGDQTSAKVQRKYSNPRRYSYLLGEGIGGYTPNKYLAKGIVVNEKDLLERFSVEVLTKAFYNELSDWYAWAVKVIRFPNDINDKTDDDKLNHECAIRLITRLIFSWFLKQKDLVPEEFFDENYIREHFIESFNPHSQADLFGKSTESKYYKAILQNLFFAMLNSPITPEGKDDVMERRFRKDRGDYDNNKLMRYEGLFKNPQLFVDIANRTVPFLNGGLFDCLDDKDNGMYIDGFSDRKVVYDHLIVPDYLFFGEEVGKDIDLSAFYGDAKKKRVSARGVIDILKRYNFTVEENTPFDQEVSLDPELLGKVFENLLASYNPETKTTARKQTGSFYTPREIVQYMVDESLVAHLKRTVGEELEVAYRQLMQYTDEDPNLTDGQKELIMRSLFNCKVLDPACGSGAFPVGMLQQMVHVLTQLDPNNTKWREILMQDAIDETSEAYKTSSSEDRKENIADIERNFNEKYNSPDYARKLYLIENTIFGVDIQPIAVQISKLRFFISLVVDQKPNDNPADNFGIRPLPNLEAKFVAANTLIGLNKKDVSLFYTDEIKVKERELRDAKHKIFGAKTSKTKRKYREVVKTLRVEIVQILGQLGAVGNDEAAKLASWDMFDQNASSPFFDPEWMFGVSGGFDIVIGNPPYLKEGRASKAVFDGVRNSPYYQGKMDLWYMFACCGIDFLSDNGVLSFIATNNWVTNSGASIMRNKVVEDSKILQLCDFSNFMIFESASIQTMVMLFEKNKAVDNYEVDYRRLIGDTKLTDVVALLKKEQAIQVEYLTPIINRGSFTDKYITFSSNEAILNKISSCNNIIYLTNNEVANGIHPHYDFVNSKISQSSKFNVGDGIFGLSENERESLNLLDSEKRLIKPYYNNAELVNRYYTTQKNKFWIIYTDSSFKKPKSMNQYPNLRAHLDKFAEIITSDNRPYGLHRSREERFFTGEKVIALRKCVGRPLFSYSDFDCYLSATFYVIKTNRVDMKYLTGLLNSKLIKFWLKNRGKMQGNNYQLDKEPLVAIPIAAPVLGLQQPVINLVDRIIVAYQEGKTEEIASIEAQINSHIYRLYNISDEEKAIIDPEGQKPASEETIKRICETMDKNFSLLLPILCDSAYTLENLNQIDSSQITVDRELTVFNLRKMLIQLQVFNLIANLDLTTYLRSNYRAESNPEKRCNLKYIIIFTCEIYGCLFDYKNACNGKLEMLKSLANHLGDSELITDIDNFEQYAKKFGRLSADRRARNISVHYDQNPLDVYDKLEVVNEKEEVDRLCVSLGMLESLSIIVKKYAHKYQVPMTPSNNHYNLSPKEGVNVFPDKDSKLRNMLSDSIDKFSTRLDYIVQSSRQTGIVAEKLNIGKEFIKDIKPCIDSINPGIHMHFIYLDLSSAIRAYFNAECYYEKQVNLRRIIIIVYEGFKHIYGYNETDLSLSFWRKQIFPILESTKDIAIKELLLQVECELKAFASSITISDVQRRERSIHYRFKYRDNTLPLFHDIIESNPFVEMKRALDLVNLLNKLIELNTNSIAAIHEIQNRKSQKSTEETIGKLNDITSIIELSNASDEQKQSFKETTEKIKNLLSIFSS